MVSRSLLALPLYEVRSRLVVSYISGIQTLSNFFLVEHHLASGGSEDGGFDLTFMLFVADDVK
jgi:hypothetical protein